MRHPQIQPVRRSIWRICLYLPVALLLLLTIGFWLFDWDRELISLVFRDGQFIYRDLGIFRLLYEVGPWPGILLGSASLLYVLVSLARRRKNDLRLISLGISLSVILGPGVVVNFIFKDHYGRPRPKQVEEFGGEMEYLPVLVPGTEKYARSFPSGHSASGYVLLVLFLTGIAVREPRAGWILAIAILYGSLIGVVRVLQGAHWPSDILWSCGIVYYTTLAILYGLGIFRPIRARVVSRNCQSTDRDHDRGNHEP